MTVEKSYNLQADLELLRSAAVSAGILALSYFRRSVTTWEKKNASPVSDADLAVDHFLSGVLLAARPEYGWLSEETEDSPERLTANRVFIVDPIDGTRAFLRGETVWSVSLAIVENGEATCGVIYAPARDELYAASKGHGAHFNTTPMLRQVVKKDLPLIPAPGAVHTALAELGLEYKRGPAYPSLAYRLVQVGRGTLDAAVARRGAEDWDIAAAAIILAECGADFEDVCVGTPRFNKPDTRHGALAATAIKELKSPLRTALKKVYGCPGTETEKADSV